MQAPNRDTRDHGTDSHGLQDLVDSITQQWCVMQARKSLGEEVRSILAHGASGSVDRRGFPSPASARKGLRERRLRGNDGPHGAGRNARHVVPGKTGIHRLMPGIANPDTGAVPRSSIQPVRRAPMRCPGWTEPRRRPETTLATPVRRAPVARSAEGGPLRIAVRLAKRPLAGRGRPAPDPGVHRRRRQLRAAPHRERAGGRDRDRARAPDGAARPRLLPPARRSPRALDRRLPERRARDTRPRGAACPRTRGIDPGAAQVHTPRHHRPGSRRPPLSAELERYVGAHSLFRTSRAEVASFHMFSSVLRSSGARYAVEATFPLTGEPPEGHGPE